VRHQCCSRRKGTPRPGNVVEALSANTRRCRDMESLFCDFHVGNVGMGVTGRGRGHSLRGTCTGYVEPLSVVFSPEVQLDE
jgi:hypothetical protein